MAKPAPPSITHRDLATPKSYGKAFDAPGTLFELKHDGFRVLASNAGGQARLLSRRGNDLGPSFPEILDALARLPDLVLDGELVVVDENGAPRFERLMSRAAKKSRLSVQAASRADPAAVFAFDLLALDGKDLRALPLLKRKAALKKALARSRRVLYLDHVAERGVRLFEAVDGLGLEGIVAKRGDAPYRAGSATDWLKIKTEHGRHADTVRAKWNR